MREIKFRAWVKDWDEMVEVDGISFRRHTYSDNPEIIDQRNDCHAMGAVVLMQYTGLKDKSGTEVYEGDIVKSIYESACYPVVFKNGGFFVHQVLLSHNHQSTIETVGNVFQDSELLERTDHETKT